MDYCISDIQRMQLRILKEVVELCDKHSINYYAAYGTVLGAIRHGGFIPWDDDVDIYIPETELDYFVSVMEQELNDSFILDFRRKDRRFRDFPRIGYKEYDTNILHVDVFRLAGAPDSIEQQKRLRKKTGILHKIINLKQKGLWSYITNKHKTKEALFAYIATFFIPLKLLVQVSDYYCKRYPYELSSFVGHSASGSIRSIIPKTFLGNGTIIKFEDMEIRIPEQYENYLRKMYGNYMEYPPEDYREKMMNKTYHVITNPRNGLKTLV